MMVIKQTFWELSNLLGSHLMRELGFKLKKLKRLPLILKDSRLTFMASSEITIMKANGKMLMREKFQTTLMLRMTTTLIPLQRMCLKNSLLRV